LTPPVPVTNPFQGGGPPLKIKPWQKAALAFKKTAGNLAFQLPFEIAVSDRNSLDKNRTGFKEI
jgi:hypothetical protein